MSHIDGRPVNPTYPVPGAPPTGPSPAPQATATDPLSQAAVEGAAQDAAQDAAKVSPNGSAQPSVNLLDSHPTTHTVKAGESLSAIAQQYFGDPKLYQKLFEANRDQLSNPNQLRKGMVLKLPAALFPAPAVAPVPQPRPAHLAPPAETQTAQESAPLANPTTHTVKGGDSLSRIAKKYFGNPNLYLEIYNANRDQLRHPNSVLQKGMVLKLPPELFPKPAPAETPPTPEPQALVDYRRQNPLSYVTLHDESADPKLEYPGPVLHASDATQVAPSPQMLAAELLGQRGGLEPDAELGNDAQEDLKELLSSPDVAKTDSVLHDDAVKVDKVFDVQHGMTLGNLSSKYGDWLKTTAGILRDHNANFKLPNKEGGTTLLGPDEMEALAAKPYAEVRKYFREDLGIAFVNTLWAMDDVAVDMQHDPYYEDVKSIPKTVDLNAVADKFNLANDKLNYLAHTHAHHHKQVPIELHGAPDQIRSQSTGGKSAAEILDGLKGNFDARGRLTKPAEFEKQVYAILADDSARRQLVQQFGLDSSENLSKWAAAITSEGGVADKQRDYNSYFSVGAVMLNRALGRNLRRAASQMAAGKALDDYKPISMEQIIKEKGQFEITWKAAPGTHGKTIYDYNLGLNQAFLKGRLKEDGNSYDAFQKAYEVSRDLISGMSHMQAEVNGTPQKNTGRSVSDFFYFNQSHSRDYSSNQDSAVAYIDDNNTHVFFKEWDHIAFFR